MTFALLFVACTVLQGAQPLRKADLVRLLAAGRLSKPAIAALVRRNCVTFRPSARDRTELRTAGADDAVLAAIDQCLQARAAARPPSPQPPAPSPKPPTAPAPPLHVFANQQLTASVGSETSLEVQLLRGAVPQRGVLLLLRGASAVPGGVTQDPTAITDGRGFATFPLLAGTAPGTYRLAVAIPGGAPLGPTADISLVTTPVAQAPNPEPPPPAPKPAPGPSEQRTQFARGAGAGLHATVGTTLATPLLLEVRDEGGAALAGQTVTFSVAGGGKGGATVRPEVAKTDAAGMVDVRVTLGERAGPVVVTASVGGFTLTATVYADPGPPRDLVILRGDTAVSSLELHSRDSVALRVVARDTYGNSTALENFAVVPTTRAVALRTARGPGADSATGFVAIVPRKNGMGTLEISGSGLVARVPLRVALAGPSVAPWAIGARSAWLGANSAWLGSALTSVSGAGVAVFGRRTVIPGLSFALGGAAGSLSGDRTTAGGSSVSVLLLEGYGGAEWSLLPRAPVSPVLSLGAGAYRLKSDDDGQTVYHTSEFWWGGVGADIIVAPTVTLELRGERHWMRDAGQGHVATVWPVAAGVRVAL